MYESVGQATLLELVGNLLILEVYLLWFSIAKQLRLVQKKGV